MKNLFLVCFILFSAESYAETVDCSVYTLGAGDDNIGLYSGVVELVKSTSGESLVGSIVFELPEEVPLNDNKKNGAKNTYRLEISLERQEKTSKWVIDGASIRAGVTLSKRGKILTYQEYSSNTLYNKSDQRIANDGKVVGVNATLLSPLAIDEVLQMSGDAIEVIGVKTTVKDLIAELGFQNAAVHLALQGRVKPTLMTGVQINCTN